MVDGMRGGSEKERWRGRERREGERSLALFLPHNTYAHTYIHVLYIHHTRLTPGETRERGTGEERERERETVQMTAVVPGEYM